MSSMSVAFLQISQPDIYRKQSTAAVKDAGQ